MFVQLDKEVLLVLTVIFLVPVVATNESASYAKCKICNA